jgi:hypothetical protein
MHFFSQISVKTQKSILIGTTFISLFPNLETKLLKMLLFGLIEASATVVISILVAIVVATLPFSFKLFLNVTCGRFISYVRSIKFFN